MTMKTKFNLWMLALFAALLSILIPVADVQAQISVQPLPVDVQARIGFSHVARIKRADVTNGVIYNQWRVLPQSGTFETGDVIDRLGVYLESPFYVTNANAGSNAVFLNIGITGATNAALSQFPVSSNSTTLAFTTNLVAPIFISAATNYLSASLTFSNTAMSAVGDLGDARIYIRLTRFDRLRDY